MGKLSNCLCKKCGNGFYCKPYLIKKGGGLYCSRKCYFLDHTTELVCEGCGTKLRISKTWSHRKRKFCSRACRVQAKTAQLVCQNCGVEFRAEKSKPRKYCSRICRNAKEGDAVPEPPARMISRFWAQVKKSDGCWIFGTGTRRDYQQFHRRGADGGPILAHVFSFELHHGPVPEGQLVRHNCDNPPCIRPDHIISGTPKQNTQDMVDRGRANHVHKRLVLADVREIRNRREKGAKVVHLAKEYNVSSATISHIVNYRTWKHA